MKTLYEKGMKEWNGKTNDFSGKPLAYWDKDVREAIKELKKKLELVCNVESVLIDVFGKELVK